MSNKTSAIGINKLIISTLATLSLFTLSQVNAADMCIQVIQPAINDTTKECKEFPTPCDVPTGWTTTDSCPASTDTQLIPTKTLNPNFEVKKFASCSDMKKVIKDYVKNNYNSFPSYPILYRGGVMLDDVAPTSSISKDAAVGGVSQNETKTTSDIAKVFSETNSQVANVDEPEIVKTDGKYIYYYNSKDQKIYISLAFPANDAKVIKKIALPSNFVDPKIFINGTKLVILSTKYSNRDYSYFWFNRDVKTAVVVYDISDLENLKIDRFYQVDGNVIESRKIGNYIYIISKNDFYMPYGIYYGNGIKGFNETKFDSDINVEKVLPEKADMTRATSVARRNVIVNGRKYDYNLTSGNAANDCSDIEYIMPDQATIKQNNFNPSIVTLSIIDTSDATKKVKSKLLFGDVSNIYMSEKNLYITSSMYTNEDYACPAIMCIKAPCPQKCVAPIYYRGSNTIIHKIAIDKDTTTYKTSTIVPGNPLNQYSMDEDSKGEFRILTSSYYPDRYTNLYILGNDLSLVGKLENIEKGEDYKSNRFIGNKLFLVTFKQIDPLFAIDLSDSANPKILGQLKMPGYSTYLHPYDENHLIGLGYNTKENQWGGTVNDGVKVDLYDISDFANPKVSASLKLGDNYSYADALNDPRLFVWDKSTKMLYLTAMLYTSANDTTNTYRNSDVFQGTLALNIDASTGIKEKARITHIDMTGLEEARQKECKQYANTATPQCVKIIGGGEYCPPANTYVPPYCYEGSTIGEYLANTIWNQNNNFILRNVFIDNNLYTISNNKIQINDTASNYSKVGDIIFK